MSNISLTTLGGVRENGKNMYIAEIDDSIFVLDAGLKYPENEQLGVDVVIPNMDYLFENSDRIAGVFLTHGHADAIGALPYLLAEAKVPVFGSSNNASNFCAPTSAPCFSKNWSSASVIGIACNHVTYSSSKSKDSSSHKKG